MTAAKPSAKGRAHGFRVKRIYEPAAADDGFRVLVDRLWPRGVAKAKAHIDEWLKDVAPSDALRHRFHDHPAKSAAASLREKARHEPVTLLYAARDESHNNAVALKEWLERHH